MRPKKTREGGKVTVNPPRKENLKRKQQKKKVLQSADLDAGDKFLTISRCKALSYSDPVNGW